MKFPINNKSIVSLGIMLEPWTDTVELEPGQTADVHFEGRADDLVIDFHDENFFSLLVPPGATITVRK